MFAAISGWIVGALGKLGRGLLQVLNPLAPQICFRCHALGMVAGLLWDFIKRSLGSIVQGNELQQQTLHGAGSSSAQLIMVLQLIMHLLNRIGHSLRMGNRENSDQDDLTFGPDSGGESGSLQSMVDSAQVIQNHTWWAGQA